MIEMESFKVYLPSNVSTEHFPNNTTSNYRTHFTHPIKLEGQWEVGAEAMFYAPITRDKYETASIQFEIFTTEWAYWNDVAEYKFRVSDKRKWLGYDDHRPTKMEFKKTEIDEVIKCLNDVNRTLLTEESFAKNGNFFTFFRTESGKVAYSCKIPDMVLNITPKMAAYLGFRSYHPTFAVGNDTRTAPSLPKVKDKTALKPSNYDIAVFSQSFVKREERIVLKASGEKFENIKEDLMKVWNERVSKIYDSALAFSESGKLIVHNKELRGALLFSKEFGHRFGHQMPLCIRTSQWALSAADLQSQHQYETWFVDVYKDELGIFPHGVRDVVKHELKPRQFQSNSKLVEHLNQVSHREVAYVMRSKDPPNGFKVHFEIERDYCFLRVEPWVQVTLSENLAKMLGFTNSTTFRNTSALAPFSLTSIELQQQRLLIITDFTEHIAIGNKRACILQDFIHTKNEEGIKEKRFYPVNYVPVSKSYLDSVWIQLTDSNFKPVKIHDSHSVLILHFRKVF